MNKKQRTKLLWDIFDLINREHCNNKLKLNKIIFFNDVDFYRGKYRPNKKEIHIWYKQKDIFLIQTFIHELTHAYERQVNCKYWEEKYKGLTKKQIKELSHSKKFIRTFKKIFDTIDKHMDIKIV